MKVHVGCEHFACASYNHNIKTLDSDFLEWQNMEMVKVSNKKGKTGVVVSRGCRGCRGGKDEAVKLSTVLLRWLHIYTCSKHTECSPSRVSRCKTACYGWECWVSAGSSDETGAPLCRGLLCIEGVHQCGQRTHPKSLDFLPNFTVILKLLWTKQNQLKELLGKELTRFH